jgi:ABC-type sugar transport system ATPase subunit
VFQLLSYRAEPRMRDLIKIERANKHYDGVQALRDAHLAIRPGEVHALMGENGAGKSTLTKILAGAVRPDSAEIWWEDQRISITSPLDAQRQGIGVVFQELDLFPNLSVGENIVIGNMQMEGRRWIDRRGLAQFCRPLMERVGLITGAHARLGDLRIGEMQLVAIARALGFRARLILMDEPTSSLSGDAVANLFALIRDLKKLGVAIVYVSHKMDEVFALADRVTVMRDGATIETRAVSEITANQVIALMVGRELQETEAPPATVGECLLSVAELRTRKLHGVSFELRRGEVLGIAGLVGAGRSEIGAALFGLDPIIGGTIRLKGRAFRPRSPRHAIRRGLGLLPEDRKLEGLMMQMSVLQNSTMAVLHGFQKYGFLTRGEAAAVGPVHLRVRLKAASEDVSVSTLSGGSQQKVLLSKWLLADPDVLFLDEPTRGIDVAAKSDIYEIIRELAIQGKGIVFASSELPELLRCCHRILVMCGGRSVEILDARTATQEQIMRLATPRTAS